MKKSKELADVLKELGWPSELIDAVSDADAVLDIQAVNEFGSNLNDAVADTSMPELTLSGAPIVGGQVIALEIGHNQKTVLEIREPLR